MRIMTTMKHVQLYVCDSVNVILFRFRLRPAYCKRLAAPTTDRQMIDVLSKYKQNMCNTKRKPQPWSDWTTNMRRCIACGNERTNDPYRESIGAAKPNCVELRSCRYSEQTVSDELIFSLRRWTHVASDCHGQETKMPIVTIFIFSLSLSLFSLWIIE